MSKAPKREVASRFCTVRLTQPMLSALLGEAAKRTIESGERASIGTVIREAVAKHLLALQEAQASAVQPVAKT